MGLVAGEVKSAWPCSLWALCPGMRGSGTRWGRPQHRIPAGNTNPPQPPGPQHPQLSLGLGFGIKNVLLESSKVGWSPAAGPVPAGLCMGDVSKCLKAWSGDPRQVRSHRITSQGIHWIPVQPLTPQQPLPVPESIVKRSWSSGTPSLGSQQCPTPSGGNLSLIPIPTLPWHSLELPWLLRQMQRGAISAWGSLPSPGTGSSSQGRESEGCTRQDAVSKKMSLFIVHVGFYCSDPLPKSHVVQKISEKRSST